MSFSRPQSNKKDPKVPKPQTEVDASKQESKGANFAKKKNNAKKNARRKANKRKRLAEAREDEQNGWTVVKYKKHRNRKAKPKTSSTTSKVTQKPNGTKYLKNKKKVVPVDINNRFSILAKLGENVKASKTTKKAKQFKKVFQTAESLAVKETLINDENVKDPKQSVCPLALPSETQTETEAPEQESREENFVTAETESPSTTVSSRLSAINNAKREKDEAHQNGWCVVS